jgi:hypothetical protein
MARDDVQLEDLKSRLRSSSRISVRNGSDVDVQSGVNDVVHYRLYKRRYSGLIGFVSELQAHPRSLELT